MRAADIRLIISGILPAIGANRIGVRGLVFGGAGKSNQAWAEEVDEAATAGHGEVAILTQFRGFAIILSLFSHNRGLSFGPPIGRHPCRQHKPGLGSRRQ